MVYPTQLCWRYHSLPPRQWFVFLLAALEILKMATFCAVSENLINIMTFPFEFIMWYLTDMNKKSNNPSKYFWLSDNQCFLFYESRQIIQSFVCWNENVINVTKFSSLVALKIGKMTTSGVGLDENITKKSTFLFQCEFCLCRVCWLVYVMVNCRYMWLRMIWYCIRHNVGEQKHSLEPGTRTPYSSMG